MSGPTSSSSPAWHGGSRDDASGGPTGGHPRESWRTLFYANLIKDFADEILGASGRNQGNFEDGARVQEVINAVELSFQERRWIEFPLNR